MGGTKMISAVVSDDLRILARRKRPTEAQEGADAVLGRIMENIRGALTKAGSEEPKLRLDGIGIAVPGTIDREQGVVLETPNLAMKNYPLGRRLRKEFGVPVVLVNDVSAGVYGEYIAGAARGFRHVIGLFVGTGIGGGLVLDGRLYGGATGNAGEIGHTIILNGGPLCGCGRRGCVESLASRTAMAKDIVALAGAGAAPGVLERAGTDIKLVKSGVLSRSVEEGESRVIDVIEKAAEYLGIAMANCANILSPEVFVLGGGVVEKLGEFYVDAARRSMHAHGMKSLVGSVEVVAAQLGDDAVPIGAAALAREAYHA